MQSFIKIGQGHNDPEASQKRDFRVLPPGLHEKLGHFWNPDKILKKMKWCWPWARHFLTHFRPILEYFFRKNSNFDQKNPFLTEIFFFKIKFEKLSGVSKNKIWDILGQFGHNLALKKAREKQVYCRFWGLLDHCAEGRPHSVLASIEPRVVLASRELLYFHCHKFGFAAV